MATAAFYQLLSGATLGQAAACMMFIPEITKGIQVTHGNHSEGHLQCMLLSVGILPVTKTFANCPAQTCKSFASANDQPLEHLYFQWWDANMLQAFNFSSTLDARILLVCAISTTLPISVAQFCLKNAAPGSWGMSSINGPTHIQKDGVESDIGTLELFAQFNVLLL
eukprot:1147571-Pelagomonas_calceolata.AAC.8